MPTPLTIKHANEVTLRREWEAGHLDTSVQGLMHVLLGFNVLLR